jgi:hypothetical protein
VWCRADLRNATDEAAVVGSHSLGNHLFQPR